ncbi:DUF5686 family protein [Zhouia spongiae]|uniref:DUF5686 family protein n=1 Tax=Zhouia spongiae TaxID=2202721 RepID=A0ABY3YP32_9FLAO|nr:DUF5686 family protein [Zhouia spongiae]UNY99294.1 DUF5686 family protein [Zhouia spongiae]
MKKIFFFVLSLCFSLTFAQQKINGKIKDNETNNGLSYASITTGTGVKAVSGTDGSFSIKTNNKIKTVRIELWGYQTAEVPVSDEKSYYEITLTKNIESLQETALKHTTDASEIIRDVINNKNRNNPETSLNSFKLKSYNKLIATADPNTIDNQIDSVFLKKKKGLKFIEADSTAYKLKRQLYSSHLFITEKISSVVFDKENGKHETILGSNVAGFKEPVYEILALKIQSFSFYKDKYTLFGTEYAGPLADRALKKYNYRVVDTLNTDRGSTYIIHFQGKKRQKSATPEGLLYISADSYALQKGIIKLKAVIDIEASQEFEYFEENDIWFPVEKNISISKGSSSNAINLFGGNILLTNLKEKDIDTTKTIHTSYFNPAEVIKITVRDLNYGISINKPVNRSKTKFTVEVDENAVHQNNAFWKENRSDPLTDKELNTYTYADSVTQAAKAEKKIGLIRKLLVGYVPLSYVDLDIKSVIKYNNFEGFRLGGGITTSNNFSKVLRLNAYGAFGTKDQDFKYGLGAKVRLNRNTSTWLGFDYIDDLTETGSTKYITDTRAFSIFEPRLFNITMFHNSKSIASHLSYDITPQLSSKLRLQKADIIPKYTYNYINEGTNFDTYKITTTTLGIQWNPKNLYMLTSDGKKVIRNSFPQFSLQYTQAIKGLLDGYFTFSKVDFRARYHLNPLNKGRTSFLINAGLGLGDIPLTHLYQTAPNQPDGNKILKRFSVGGGDSFETMYFNEFFSDKYLSVEAKHYFKRVKIAGRFKPEFGLASRFAIGDIKNPDLHEGIGFNSLNKGYMESGFEINRILKGFGLSFMYRHGAYHLPAFDENVSFKFTYYFSLGF